MQLDLFTMNKEIKRKQETLIHINIYAITFIYHEQRRKRKQETLTHINIYAITFIYHE